MGGQGVEASLVEEGDRLMAEATGALLAGQEVVHGTLPRVGKRSSGSQRKHQSSPGYVRLAQEMRMLLRLERWIREGRKVGWLVATRMTMKGMNIRLPSLANEGEGLGVRGWLGYARVLRKKAEELRSELH